MNKMQALTIIGYLTVFSAGILFGTAINIPQKGQNREIFAENEAVAEEIKETAPVQSENGVYFLKIDDGVLKQYRISSDGVAEFEKALPYIDVLSLGGEYSEKLHSGVTLTGTRALAEFIENLDS